MERLALYTRLGGLAARFEGTSVIAGDRVNHLSATYCLSLTTRTCLSSNTIRRDDLIVRFPNSQLLHQPIINISRAKRSQVKQSLRFKYADLNKIPTILQQVKEGVKESCPKLVTQGTTYRAVITSFEADHVQALVNFHFDIPAETEAFNRNRQEVLLVIARVMQENDVEFALPTLHTNP